MSHQLNYLKMHRIKTPLSQRDVSFLIGLTDATNLSRIEKGQRQASVEFLLNYHHLFAMSIESFYEPQSETVQYCLLKRIGLFIEEIKKDNNTGKNNPKIKFLNEVIIRLSKNKHYENIINTK